MTNKLKENYLVQAWLVLFLALFFGALLSFMQIALGSKIEENKINETKQKVPELILADDGEELDIKGTWIEVAKENQKAVYNVFEARDKEQNLKGYVVKANGSGYADKIELLIGLSNDFGKILGVFVLDQKETPGLGNKIIQDEWRGQFIQKETKELLKVVKNGAPKENEIDAVTGATISSKAVVSIVNKAVQDIKEEKLKNSN